jgi:hypothetical protein
MSLTGTDKVSWLMASENVISVQGLVESAKFSMPPVSKLLFEPYFSNTTM